MAPLLMAEPRSPRVLAGMLPRVAGASERSGLEALAHLGRSAAQFINHGGWPCAAWRSGRPGRLASSQPRPRTLSPPPAAGPSIIPAQEAGSDKRRPGSPTM